MIIGSRIQDEVLVMDIMNKKARMFISPVEQVKFPGQNQCFTVNMSIDLYPDLKIEIGKVLRKYWKDVTTNTEIYGSGAVVAYYFWNKYSAVNARRIVTESFLVPLNAITLPSKDIYV